MVDIYYYGHSCFRVKGKKNSVVVDPFHSSTGLKLPKDLAADIVLSTHDHEGHNNVAAVSGDPVVLTGPGEYEIKGVTVFGLGTFHDNEKGKKHGQNTIYKFTVDGITFLHLGDLGEKIKIGDMQEFSDIDVLMVPAGDAITIDAKEACDLISELEPTVVLPMHYKTSKHDPKTVLHDVNEFEKKCGLKAEKVSGKISLAKEKLPEQTTLYIFE